MGDAEPQVILAAGGLVWREGRDGPELAVVHRSRHEDWSLPKGKLEDGEAPDQAALREVLEEVGCRARITSYADRVVYAVGGRPKVVFFWHMTPVDEDARSPVEGEIDRVEWLPVAEALELLSYEGERELVRQSAGGRAEPA
jgi:8-oxo-dGTP pyrophosphatase MutT (NUDIX family)